MVDTTENKQIPAYNNTWSNIKSYRQNGLLSLLMGGVSEFPDIFSLSMGPRTLIVVTHPDAVRQVLVTDRDSYTKGKSMNTVREVLLGNGVVTSVDEDWYSQRLFLAPFFTPRTVGQFAGMMIEEAAALVHRWQSLDTSQPFELTVEMDDVTARIILKTLFSTLDDGELDNLRGDVHTMIDYSMIRSYSPVKLPLWMPTSHIKTYTAARDRIHGYIQSIIDARRQLNPSDYPDDFLSTLLLGEIDGQKLTAQEIFDQTMTFFVAGQETSARTLAFIIYALSQNPEVEARLIAEIDQVMGESDGLPTADAVRGMSYSIKVIKEAMRLYPATAFYPRDVAKDTVLHGYPLAAGSMIMLFPYATQRRADFWPDPLRFDPERFAPEQEKQRHPQAYYPFSAGPRICMGNHFALLEMQIVLVMIYSAYRLRLLEGHDPNIGTPSMLAPMNGLPMMLHSRHS